MKRNFKSDIVSDNFQTDSTKFKEEAIKNFTEQSNSLVIPNSGWEDDIEHDLIELERQIEKTTHIWREKQLEKLI